MGRDCPKAAIQSWVFKGFSAAGSVTPPHVWPQGVIEIKSAANQCLPAGHTLSRDQALTALSTWYEQVQVGMFPAQWEGGLHAVMTKRTGYCQGTFKNIYKIRFKKESTGFSVLKSTYQKNSLPRKYVLKC